MKTNTDDDRPLTRGETVRLKDFLYPPDVSDDEFQLCHVCDGEGKLSVGCTVDSPIQASCYACGGRGEVLKARAN